MRKNSKTASLIRPDECAVFFYLDNTIAEKDVFDDMLVCFSENKRWERLEKKWRLGLIGSRACLEGQIRGIRITKNRLDSYLSGIKIDPYFKKLLNLLRAKKIKATILSDNFDYILKKILAVNAAEKIKIYSNKMHFSNDRLIPEFPFMDKKCRICAHCKKKNLLANLDGQSIIIYIGDGRSDICPAKYAHIVFAKDELLKFCRKEKLFHIPYKEFKEVYAYLKRRLA